MQFLWIFYKLLKFSQIIIFICAILNTSICKKLFSFLSKAILWKLPLHYDEIQCNVYTTKFLFSVNFIIYGTHAVMSETFLRFHENCKLYYHNCISLKWNILYYVLYRNSLCTCVTQGCKCKKFPHINYKFCFRLCNHAISQVLLITPVDNFT